MMMMVQKKHPMVVAQWSNIKLRIMTCQPQQIHILHKRVHLGCPTGHNDNNIHNKHLVLVFSALIDL